MPEQVRERLLLDTADVQVEASEVLRLPHVGADVFDRLDEEAARAARGIEDHFARRGSICCTMKRITGRGV